MSRKYSHRYNSFYDEEKNIWLNNKCSKDCECEFCLGRPNKPLDNLSTVMSMEESFVITRKLRLEKIDRDRKRS